jgi:hypothetical protein
MSSPVYALTSALASAPVVSQETVLQLMSPASAPVFAHREFKSVPFPFTPVSQETALQLMSLFPKVEPEPDPESYLPLQEEDQSLPLEFLREEMLTHAHGAEFWPNPQDYFNSPTVPQLPYSTILAAIHNGIVSPRITFAIAEQSQIRRDARAAQRALGLIPDRARLVKNTSMSMLLRDKKRAAGGAFQSLPADATF